MCNLLPAILLQLHVHIADEFIHVIIVCTLQGCHALANEKQWYYNVIPQEIRNSGITLLISYCTYIYYRPSSSRQDYTKVYRYNALMCERVCACLCVRVCMCLCV